MPIGIFDYLRQRRRFKGANHLCSSVFFEIAIVVCRAKRLAQNLDATAVEAVQQLRTAITVITAVAFGGEAGFTVGSLSAVVSNFYFGQGPWTPFQMFSWGIIGLLAGLLRRLLKKHIAILCIYGALAGIAYSLTMDVWTVLWSEGAFVPKEYAAAVIAALPLTAVYAVSNVVFLLLLAGPVGKKLERIKEKDGLFLSE